MLHLDGFEQYANETNMNSALFRADYTPFGNWSSVSGRGRFSRALSGSKSSIARKLAWTGDKFSIGFTASFNARGSLAALSAGGQLLTLWMNPDTGLPNLNDVVGGALPTINRYYFYELEMDRSDSKIRLYINNRFDCEYVMPGAMTAANEVTALLGYVDPVTYRPGVMPVPNDNSVKTVDDFYMLDKARLGPIVITTRFPDSDVKADWFNSQAGNHASTLSTLPPVPLDVFVASDTVGKEDRFKSSQAMTNANDVVATGLVVLARKSPTINAKLGVFMGGNGGMPGRDDERAVESDWRTQFICFEKIDGDTPANIVTGEFGINVSPP